MKNNELIRSIESTRLPQRVDSFFQSQVNWRSDWLSLLHFTEHADHGLCGQTAATEQLHAQNVGMCFVIMGTVARGQRRGMHRSFISQNVSCLMGDRRSQFLSGHVIHQASRYIQITTGPGVSCDGIGGQYANGKLMTCPV